MSFQIKDILSSSPHSHTSDSTKTAATKVRSELKHQAGTTRGTPSQLLADTTSTVSLDIRAALGEMDTVKRSLRHERAKHQPKNPASVQDLVVHGEWTTTMDGDNFLVYDNGVDSASRMLVFASDAALTHLASSSTWFMDGTFDSCPSLFQQLYVIRAPLGESYVSCVYAFLSDKDQSTYEELLSAIVDKCEDLGFQPDPECINMDFESAAMNSVRSVFGPHVQVHGSYRVCNPKIDICMF